MNNYYPFGLMWDNPDAMPNATYQGKEFQTNTFSDGSELALYDFGARMYDPVLGRWHCSDPLYQFDSPYIAMANKPVVNIDPDGMWSIPWGNIVSNLGTYMNTIRTFIVSPRDFVSGHWEYSSSGFGKALQIAGTLLQAWQDGKMIQEAGGETGRNYNLTSNNLNSLQSVSSKMEDANPPQTQEEVDRIYKDSFREFQRLINEKADLVPGSFDGLDPVSRNKAITAIRLAALEGVLLPNDGSGFALQVVEFEVFGRDPLRMDLSNPEGEVPGTREFIEIIEPQFRPEQPIFENPGRVRPSGGGQRTYGIVNSDGTDIDNSTQWRILIRFQIIEYN